jgi:serine/threonine protein kinase
VKILGANIYSSYAQIVYSYVPGQTLREWVEEGQTKEERARVLSEITRAIVSIHSKGYAHLDINPNNIWVPSDPTQPAFLLDLGSMHSIGAERRQVTMTRRFSPGPFNNNYRHITSKRARKQLNYFSLREITKLLNPKNE